MNVEKERKLFLKKQNRKTKEERNCDHLRQESGGEKVKEKKEKRE